MSSAFDPVGAVPSESSSVTGFSPLVVKGRQLVEGLKPFMAAKDLRCVVSHLSQAGWDEPALISLLTCSDANVVRVATWALAHVGTMKANLPLASVLHHDDADLAELAENALWSLWLRSADMALCAQLCQAIRLCEKDDCDEALEIFNSIIEECPNFAEAYNQRAIVKFIKSDYVGAVADYLQAVALNPVHFGALAGVGHCYAAMGRHRDAMNVYRQVLEIHPRMEGIRTAIAQIRQMVGTCGQAGKLPTYWAMS